MSIKLMTKAWETDQKGNELLVLLAMCDFANDEGVCFPSLKTLGEKAKVAKTTLSYILKAYETIGTITRTQRKRENQSDTSTVYKINTLKIDYETYKEAYQKARNYKKGSQCEHPKDDEIVNTLNHNVNTQSENCEHLEPSTLNHQSINHQKNIKKESEIKPAEIIKFYKENISSQNQKILGPKAYTQLTLHSKELKQILIGLKNYAVTNPGEYAFSLPNFIKNGIYYDYQKLVTKDSKGQAVVPKDLVGIVFYRDNQKCEFKENGYWNFEKDYLIYNPEDVREAIEEHKQGNQSQRVNQILGSAS